MRANRRVERAVDVAAAAVHPVMEMAVEIAAEEAAPVAARRPLHRPARRRRELRPLQVKALGVEAAVCGAAQPYRDCRSSSRPMTASLPMT